MSLPRDGVNAKILIRDRSIKVTAPSGNVNEKKVAELDLNFCFGFTEDKPL